VFLTRNSTAGLASKIMVTGFFFRKLISRSYVDVLSKKRNSFKFATTLSLMPSLDVGTSYLSVSWLRFISIAA
jgi:hypothetical protein